MLKAAYVRDLPHGVKLLLPACSLLLPSKFSECLHLKLHDKHADINSETDQCRLQRHHTGTTVHGGDPLPVHPLSCLGMRPQSLRQFNPQILPRESSSKVICTVLYHTMHPWQLRQEPFYPKIASTHRSAQPTARMHLAKPKVAFMTG